MNRVIFIVSDSPVFAVLFTNNFADPPFPLAVRLSVLEAAVEWRVNAFPS